MLTNKIQPEFGFEYRIYMCDSCKKEFSENGGRFHHEERNNLTLCYECLIWLACNIQFIRQEVFNDIRNRGLDIFINKNSKEKTVIPESLKWKVWERDNFTCKKCGSRKYLTADHVIPESKGGKTEEGNLQTLCKSCNSKKGVKEDAPTT